MKKFTKLFLSCAAIAALTATVAVSAMAEEIEFDMKGDQTIKATYDTEAGTLTFVPPTDIAADKAATFVAFPSTADATALTDASIVGIDQTDKGVAFDKAGLKGKPQAPAEGADNPVTYTVKLGYFTDGGQFKILEGTLFSAGILMGDVAGPGNAGPDGKVNLTDATGIAKHFVKAYLTGDALKAADVGGSKDNGPDGKVNLSDTTCVVKYFVKPSGTDHGLAGEIK